MYHCILCAKNVRNTKIQESHVTKKPQTTKLESLLGKYSNRIKQVQKGVEAIFYMLKRKIYGKHLYNQVISSIDYRTFMQLIIWKKKKQTQHQYLQIHLFVFYHLKQSTETKIIICAFLKFHSTDVHKQTWAKFQFPKRIFSQRTSTNGW